MREFHIDDTDKSKVEEFQEAINRLNKPLGSLGRLEEIALKVCLIQDTDKPQLQHPCHILFGADHGIEQEGVSASPRAITWQQMINFTKGGAGVNLFCRQHHFQLLLVDVGVDHDLSDYPAIWNRKIAWGTRNFRYEAAMTREEMEKALETGVTMTDYCYNEGCRVICMGEMGIGNTSASTMWMHFLTDCSLEACTGAGSGLDTKGQAHKRAILKDAADRFRSHHTSYDTEEIIRWFGGFEMVAALGAMLRAAERRMVILVDGFIMSACMLAASRLYPQILDYAIFCHEGEEQGHHLMLQHMGVRGLLQLGMRLGEGTGALCAYPLIESAIRMLHEMTTFEQAQITRYF